MGDTFKPVGEFEPLPKAIAQKIMAQGWPAVQGPIDIEFGCAPHAEKDKMGVSKCVWSTDGRRITVSMGGGAFIVGQSRDVDPLYAERKAALA